MDVTVDWEMLAAAFDAGQRCGEDPAAFAGDCPHGWDGDEALRRAWLSGFAIGRMIAPVEGEAATSAFSFHPEQPYRR